MQLKIATLAFVFFCSVFAIPLDIARGDNATVTLSPTSGTLQAIGKRALNADKFIQALKTIDTSETGKVGEGQCGKVYKLGKKINGKDAVVKIIYVPKIGRQETEEEAENLQIVNQLFGWGYTHDEYFCYLIMPNMGMSYKKARRRGLTKAEAVRLMHDTNQRYLHDYGLEHDDISPKQGVFRKENGRWKAELIDWEMAEKVHNFHKGHPTVPPPVILPENPGIHIPEYTEYDSEHISSGSN